MIAVPFKVGDRIRRKPGTRHAGEIATVSGYKSEGAVLVVWDKPVFSEQKRLDYSWSLENWELVNEETKVVGTVVVKTDPPILETEFVPSGFSSRDQWRKYTGENQ